MQWDASSQAGFTNAAKPWLAVNPNYSKVNAAVEGANKDSVLSFYRELIRIRKSKPVLIFGSYRDISGKHPHIYSYVRTDNSGLALVVLNFSNEPADFQLPPDIVLKRVLISNVVPTHVSLAKNIRLQAWQAAIFE